MKRCFQGKEGRPWQGSAYATWKGNADDHLASEVMDQAAETLSCRNRAERGRRKKRRMGVRWAGTPGLRRSLKQREQSPELGL